MTRRSFGMAIGAAVAWLLSSSSKNSVADELPWAEYFDYWAIDVKIESRVVHFDPRPGLTIVCSTPVWYLTLKHQGTIVWYGPVNEDMADLLENADTRINVGGRHFVKDRGSYGATCF